MAPMVAQTWRWCSLLELLNWESTEEEKSSPNSAANGEASISTVSIVAGIKRVEATGPGGFRVLWN